MKYFLIVLSVLSSIAIASPQGVPVMTYINVGTSPVTALAANKNRGYLIMQNNGSGSCQVSFTTPIVADEGLIIRTLQNYEPEESFTKSPVYMKCSVGSSIVFLETNF
jgi:hypothetical protein